MVKAQRPQGRRSGHKRDGVFDAANTTLLVILIVLFTYPLYYVLVASLSDPRLLYESPLLFWPKGVQLTSYTAVLQGSDVLVGYRNSIVYTVLGTCFGLAITVLGAYPLSRADFKGRNAFTVFFTFTMFFSGGLIPLYMVVEGLGMVNSIWAVIIPGVVSVYNMVLTRTYFQTRIPRELHESAVAAGCGAFRLLFQVYLPLSTPIIAVMVLFYAVAQWNSYFNALIFLTDRRLYSLQLFMREFLVRVEMDSNEMDRFMSAMTDNNLTGRMIQRRGLQCAIIVLSSAPLLILYPFIGRYFKEGIMVGALKG
jgi:putative aldouronate transport system permease protein